MPPKKSPDGTRSSELASNVRYLAESIQPLTDSIDRFEELLRFIWHNREEIAWLLEGKVVLEKAEDETLFCTTCEARITGLARAIRQGWSCILDDQGNVEGNFAGHCESCSAKLQDADDVPESLACEDCDTDSPVSLAVAVQEGWTNIRRDDGHGWNYLGQCAKCHEKELAELTPKPKPEVKADESKAEPAPTEKKKRTLFDK